MCGSSRAFIKDTAALPFSTTPPLWGVQFSAGKKRLVAGGKLLDNPTSISFEPAQTKIYSQNFHRAHTRIEKSKESANAAAEIIFLTPSQLYLCVFLSCCINVRIRSIFRRRQQAPHERSNGKKTRQFAQKKIHAKKKTGGQGDRNSRHLSG